LPVFPPRCGEDYSSKIAFDLRRLCGYCPRVMNAAQSANLALLLRLEPPTAGCVRA
jgi:hypothetical protein